MIVVRPNLKLEIKNFRSIKKQKIALAPITIVYGPNGAGKSSLLYALLTLKNVMLNPNQAPDGFFNYFFSNLGSFEAVIHDHQTRAKIQLGIEVERNGRKLRYQVTIGQSEAAFSLSAAEKNKFKKRTFELPVTFPYPVNQQTQETIILDSKRFSVSWNGITAEVKAESQAVTAQQEANNLAASLNAPVEILRRVAIVPLKRGFSQPHYQSTSLTPMLATESEVATLLAEDKYLEMKLSTYLEHVFEHDFRVHVKPGTALFSLDSTDKKTGVATELVNEGFGINQFVYLLALCLHRDTKWVLVEEPEIHLHPTAVRAAAKAIVEIVRDEGKGFLISTHSESLVSALLSLVARGELHPSEIAFYLAQKEGKITQFERQSVNEEGQIKGGLRSFMEGELEDIRTFLKVKE